MLIVFSLILKTLFAKMNSSNSLDDLPQDVRCVSNGEQQFLCVRCKAFKDVRHFQRHFECNVEFGNKYEYWIVGEVSRSDRRSAVSGLLVGACVAAADAHVARTAAVAPMLLASASRSTASCTHVMANDSTAAVRTAIRRQKPSEILADDPALKAFKEAAKKYHEELPRLPLVSETPPLPAASVASGSLIASMFRASTASIQTADAHHANLEASSDDIPRFSFDCEAHEDWRVVFYTFLEQQQLFICPGWKIDPNSPGAMAVAAGSKGNKQHSHEIGGVLKGPGASRKHPQIDKQPLETHLQRWHTDIYNQARNYQTAVEKAKVDETPLWGLATPRNFILELKRHLFNSVQAVQVSRKRKPDENQTIQQILYRKNERLSGDPVKALRCSIAQAVAFCENALSFNVTRSKSFQRWMKECGVVSVTSNRLAGSLLQEVADACRELLRNEIKKWTSFSVTTDAWTDRFLQHSYIAITFSGISAEPDKFDVDMIPLEVIPFDSSHTGEQLKDLLTSKIDEWSGDLFWYGMTTDNGSNFVKAVERIIQTIRDEEEIAVEEDGEGNDDDSVADDADILDEGGIQAHRCSDHLLDLIIRKVFLKDVEIAANDIAHVRVVVARVRRSLQCKLLLEKIQKDTGRPKKGLVLDVCTRWNSVFYMIDAFIESYDSLVVLFSAFKQFDKKNSKQEQYLYLPDRNVLERLKLYRRCLAEFEEKSRWLEGDKYLTMPFVAYWVSEMLNKVDSRVDEVRAPGSIHLPFVQDVWIAFQAELHRRLDPMFSSANAVMVAAALSPYFGHLPFAKERTENDGTVVSAEEVKTECWKQIYYWTVEGLMKPSIDQEVANGFRRETLVYNWNNIFVLLRQVLESPEHRQRYAIPSSGNDFKSIFEFYQSSRSLSPLIPVVKMIVSAPASSGSSERLFSGLGFLKSLKRTRLNPCTLADTSVVRTYVRSKYYDFDRLCLCIEQRRQRMYLSRSSSSIYFLYDNQDGDVE